MIENPKVQHIYEMHTRHISRDAKHLGDADGLDDVVKIMEDIHPQVYMLARCCTDGTPTLQLANWDIVRRMRIGRFSETERQQMNDLLNIHGIIYKKTSYLAMNPDFSDTIKGNIQSRLKFIYNMGFWIFQHLHPEFYKNEKINPRTS